MAIDAELRKIASELRDLTRTLLATNRLLKELVVGLPKKRASQDQIPKMVDEILSVMDETPDKPASPYDEMKQALEDVDRSKRYQNREE